MRKFTIKTEKIDGRAHLATYKKHFIPSAVTALVAVAIAVPLTAHMAASKNTGSLSSPLLTASTTQPAAATCSVPASKTTTASAVTHFVPAVNTASFFGTTPSGNGNTVASNGSSNNSGTNTNTGVGQTGNGNVAGAEANGDTQSNKGLVGVNANVPVSVLNNNDILDGNTTSALNGSLNNLAQGLNLLSNDQANTGILGTGLSL
jgi:hypothetical protein